MLPNITKSRSTADRNFTFVRYERGSDSLTVDDWEAGEEIVIALDPSTPALEQAEALFKKARKLRRTSENVEPLLQQGEEDLEYLQEVESQLESLQPGDQADLQALREIEARNFAVAKLFVFWLRSKSLLTRPG